jgi:hypothetical protein
MLSIYMALVSTADTYHNQYHAALPSWNALQENEKTRGKEMSMLQRGLYLIE